MYSQNCALRLSDSSNGCVMFDFTLPTLQIKRITAARLLESKQTVPHYYLTMEVQVRSHEEDLPFMCCWGAF